jgi:hypothetical protein
MGRGEGRGEDLGLLNCGLGVVRLIDGDETERLVSGDSFTCGRSTRVSIDWTRERGVDGATGAAIRGGEFVTPKRLLERAVRAEPATDGEALSVTGSR